MLKYFCLIFTLEFMNPSLLGGRLPAILLQQDLVSWLGLAFMGSGVHALHVPEFNQHCYVKDCKNTLFSRYI